MSSWHWSHSSLHAPLTLPDCLPGGDHLGGGAGLLLSLPLSDYPAIVVVDVLPNADGPTDREATLKLGARGQTERQRERERETARQQRMNGRMDG